MLLVSRKNGKYNKLSNKIIVCHKLYSDKKPFTHYLNKWLPLRSKEDFKENWIAFKGKLAICSTITTILNDTLFSTDAVENSSTIYELNTFCTWHVKCIWKKIHWVYFTAEFQKLRYLNIIRSKYVQCTCTLLNSQTFITTWFVLFFRKIDTKLDFSATGIFRLSLSTAGCFGGYLLSIFNNKMNCLLSESIDFHRPWSMAMKLRQTGWETFQHFKSTWLHAQAVQTDHTCSQKQVFCEAWWICSNNNRDGKGMTKLPRNLFWGDWHIRLDFMGAGMY